MTVKASAKVAVWVWCLITAGERESCCRCWCWRTETKVNVTVDNLLLLLHPGRGVVPSERSETGGDYVSLLCVCACAHSVPLVWVGGMTYYIQLVHEKLRIFPYGNVSLETSFYWLSEDIVRFKIEVGFEEKCTKMLAPFPMDFPHIPQHTVIIDDVIVVGRHLMHTYITGEARM